jgi:hypothetical protein
MSHGTVVMVKNVAACPGEVDDGEQEGEPAGLAGLEGVQPPQPVEHARP